MPDLIFNENFVVIFLIIVFSIIQSLFGVGILLFGTPTFLFLGFSFEEALSFTLPASLSVSFLQILTNIDLARDKKRSIQIITPSLILGLCILIYIQKTELIQFYVGLMLILISIIRMSKGVHEIFKGLIKKYNKVSLGIIGLIHGFTNLGGGFLTFYTSAKYSDKRLITTNIAFIYAIFALIQITFLSLFSEYTLNYLSLYLMMVSGLVFIISGRFLINKIKNRDYSRIITLIILLYGLLSLISFF